MRAAIGNSLLLYIVIIIVSIIILFFIGALSYAKAYKAKNRIVEIVEKYGDYNDNAIGEINSSLNEMGYFISDFSCPVYEENGSEFRNQNETSYGYCIYKVYGDLKKGYYYKVVSYVTFNFPLINKFIKIPVYSETKMLGKKRYNYD